MLNRLSETAQNDLANLITLLLGITIAFSMQADRFVQLDTIKIMALGWWLSCSTPWRVLCSPRS